MYAPTWGNYDDEDDSSWSWARVLLIAFLLGTAVLAVGFAGNVTATHDPNDFFALEANFPGVIWEDIHGTSTTQWAVGRQGPLAVIAKRTSGTWALDSAFTSTLQASMPSGARDVYALSDSNVYVVGGIDSGTNPPHNSVIRWDGTNWVDITDPPGTALGLNVWAVSPTSVWVVGRKDDVGNVLAYRTSSWDGAAWTIQDFSFSAAVIDQVPTSQGAGLWMETATFGVTGACARIGVSSCPQRFVEGGAWGPHGVGASMCFSNCDIWGTTQSNLWRVSSGADLQDGLIEKWDATNNKFDLITTSAEPLRAIYGVSASEIWAAGAAGGIMRYDGTSWTDHTTSMSTTMANANGIYCSSSTACWIVYDSGEIHKLQVNAATPLPSLSGLDLDRNNFNVDASQAQCLGDEVSLRITTDQSIDSGGINWYILNSDTNTVVETGSETSASSNTFYNLNGRLYHTSRPYPAGEYQFLATIDITGALSADLFSDVAFNVPANDCFGEDNSAEFDQLFTEHAHGETHHHNIEALLDQLAIGVGIFAGTLLGSTSTINILVLILIVYLSYHMYRRSNDFLIRYFWTSVIVLVCLASLTFVNDWQGMALVAGTIGVFAGYLYWRTALDHVTERRREKLAPITEHD